MNPLIPSAFDVALAALIVVACVYAAVAFLSLVRTRGISALAFLIWTLVVLFVPIVGPTAWFVSRRPGRFRPGRAVGGAR